MRKLFSRYAVVVLLCFSCILLFKSANMETDETGMEWGQEDAAVGMVPGSDTKEDAECDCGYSWRRIRFYLDGRRYVTLDVVFLTAAMVLVFVLVLNRQ